SAEGKPFLRDADRTAGVRERDQEPGRHRSAGNRFPLLDAVIGFLGHVRLLHSGRSRVFLENHAWHDRTWASTRLVLAAFGQDKPSTHCSGLRRERAYSRSLP